MVLFHIHTLLSPPKLPTRFTIITNLLNNLLLSLLHTLLINPSVVLTTLIQLLNLHLGYPSEPFAPSSTGSQYNLSAQTGFKHNNNITTSHTQLAHTGQRILIIISQRLGWKMLHFHSSGAWGKEYLVSLAEATLFRGPTSALLNLAPLTIHSLISTPFY